MELYRLQFADPARLGAEQAGWGRYYEHHPCVMAGDLRRAHAVLTERGLLGSTPPGEPTRASPAIVTRASWRSRPGGARPCCSAITANCDSMRPRAAA
ncbi:MAG: thermostable hemolysin [Halomonas sp.]|nr:thermostable hemolysin [Halomonas sp.]